MKRILNIFPKSKQSLYIKILLWAYERRHEGFTKDELKSALNVSDREWPWVQWTFFGALAGDSPLIWFISGDHMPDGQADTGRYYLTPSGTSTAIDYLELHQAKWGGYIATALGILALVFSGASGYLQSQSNRIAAESLEETRIQIAALNDPFFGIEYIESDQTFKVTAPNDIKIEGVEWYFKDATKDLRFADEMTKNRFIKMEENATSLKKSTVLNYLTEQIHSTNGDLSDQQIKYFVQCYDEYYISNPMSSIVSIQYSRRGNGKRDWVDIYVYFDRIFSQYPRVIVLNNIDHPDINRQFFAFEDFKKYLVLPSSFDWKSISKEDLSETVSGIGKCSKLFPMGSIQYGEYRVIE